MYYSSSGFYFPINCLQFSLSKWYQSTVLNQEETFYFKVLTFVEFAINVFLLIIPVISKWPK